MIKIAILTTTRAEYGLMRQLIFKMERDPEIEMSLLVTGTHLCQDYGMTINEIEHDNVKIAARIDIIDSNGGKVDVARTFSNAVTKFSDYFKSRHFDFLIIDGDRYEALAVGIAAALNQIPIIHCGGGDTTEGANDEYWRHSLTKISAIHFPTTNLSRLRIIQMGESPERVFNVGSMGLENIRIMKFMERSSIEKRVGIKLDRPFALVTFHPVTMEKNTARRQIDELLGACEKVTDMAFVFTKANADNDGQIINGAIEKFVVRHKYRSVCVASLGAECYLSAMKYCAFVMGNSSSGLVEVPSFHIPTINIGDRQKGREQAGSVINCQPTVDDIVNAIAKARDENFIKKCREAVNPNGDGYTCDKIVTHIKRIFNSGENLLVKHFNDIQFVCKA